MIRWDVVLVQKRKVLINASAAFIEENMDRSLGTTTKDVTDVMTESDILPDHSWIFYKRLVAVANLVV